VDPRATSESHLQCNSTAPSCDSPIHEPSSQPPAWRVDCLPTITFRAFDRTFGVSFFAALETLPHGAGHGAAERENGLRIARASPKVEGSGTVGPEPITERSSPTTSDRINDTTEAGEASVASRPPLIADRCFAHSVHLVNVGAAGEQEPGRLLPFRRA